MQHRTMSSHRPSIALSYLLLCSVAGGVELASLSLYTDDAFQEEAVENDPFYIGQDTQYGKVVVDPDLYNGTEVLGITIDAVYVCTTDDGTALVASVYSDSEYPGCLSTVVDPDGPYQVIGDEANGDYHGNIA